MVSPTGHFEAARYPCAQTREAGPSAGRIPRPKEVLRVRGARKALPWIAMPPISGIDWTVDTFESTSYDSTLAEERNFVEETLEGLFKSWGQAETFFQDKKILDQWWAIDDTTDSERERIRWRRAVGNMFGHEPGESLDIEITRGAVTLNAFIGALAAVAGREALLRKIIVEDELEMKGVCTFRFFKIGKWRNVTVDSYLPTVTKSRIPLYAQSANQDEVWPGLIEKAYAKIHGSYAALKYNDACSVTRALTELTGSLVTKHEIDLDEEDDEELWEKFSWHLNQGNLVCCMVEVDESGNHGMGRHALKGIIPDMVYSVAGLVELVDDTRLIKIDNPWGEAGLWRGAWGNDSGEWDLEVEYKLKEQLGVLDGDTSSFYMCVEDFFYVFNCFHICRFQFTTWNQAIITGAWYGNTAGGPPPMSPDEDATHWLLNPRYCVTIDEQSANKNKEEVECCFSMSLLNDQAGCHADAMSKRVEAGFIVFAGEMSTLTKWSEPLLHCEPRASNDIAATLDMGNVRTFTFVPYASETDFEGIFTVRIFCKVPLSYKRMPSLHSLNLRGPWVNELSGGSREHATWGCNPQYLIQAERRTEAIVTLKQKGKSAEAEGGARLFMPFGATIAKVEFDEDIHRCTPLLEGHEIVAESKYIEAEMVQFPHVFEAKTKNEVLVISLSQPDKVTNFHLNILTSNPIKLYPIPHMHIVTINGVFTHDNSGGCSINADWFRNTKFILETKHSGKFRVTMKKHGSQWANRIGQHSMIGFCILHTSTVGAEKRRRVAKEQILAETDLLPVKQVTATYELTGKQQYYVMPVTFAPKVKGKYKIQIESNTPFNFNGT